jgi:hypothetical protein
LVIHRKLHESSYFDDALERKIRVRQPEVIATITPALEAPGDSLVAHDSGQVEPAQALLKRDELGRGLARLVLTLLETIRQLMEKQARRRIRDGGLTEYEVERLGVSFMELENKISEMGRMFNLSKDDMRLGLADQDVHGARQGEFLSVVDLLDKVIEKGLIVFGDLGLSVADVELINLQLRLVISATRGSRSRRNSSQTQRRAKDARKVRIRPSRGTRVGPARTPREQYVPGRGALA